MPVRYAMIVLAVVAAGCSSRGDRAAVRKVEQPPAAAAPASAPVRQPAPFLSTPNYSAAGQLVPPMDPSRKINDQECTKQVALAAGNLRCR